MDELLQQTNNGNLHKLLLQLLNRYPYDANREMRPIQDLIDMIQAN